MVCRVWVQHGCFCNEIRKSVRSMVVSELDDKKGIVIWCPVWDR